MWEMSALARANSIWRVPLILTFTALMATLSVVLSFSSDAVRRQDWCARTWSRFILWVSRVRVDVRGLKALDTTRAYVFAANHLSMFDIWVLLACLPFSVRFVAKASLFQWPLLGWHLRQSGNIRVDRHHPRRTIRAFHGAGGKIRAGVSFVVFPEGMRTRGEKVAPFKRGSFVLARHAGAPIVPITIIGSHLLLQRGSIVINPGWMEVVVHPPIPYEDFREQELQALARRVRSTIVESYREAP